MSKEESVTTKIRTFLNKKKTTTILCFRLSNWFAFSWAWISNRIWWERTHWQRWKKRKWKRRKNKKKLGCKSIRINPDAKNYDIFVEIGKIQNHIIESTKKSLIDDLSKRLLKLEFKSNHSIKSKCLNWIFKNILPNYEKLKICNQK